MTRRHHVIPSTCA